MKLDTVTLEVIRNALPAVANEMAADLQRTSYNMMIYEVRDDPDDLPEDVDRRLGEIETALDRFDARPPAYDEDDRARAAECLRGIQEGWR